MWRQHRGHWSSDGENRRGYSKGRGKDKGTEAEGRIKVQKGSLALNGEEASGPYDSELLGRTTKMLRNLKESVRTGYRYSGEKEKSGDLLLSYRKV